MKQLWPHQQRAITLLRQSIASGKKRPLLQLPTGAGKTTVAAAIFRQAREKNPNVRLMFVVDAISLIDQTVRAFYEEGLHSIGVIQADHQMEDWSKPIQVASVQTLQRRTMYEADIIFVDETHRRNDWLFGIMASEEYKSKPFIGLSATPWSRGLGHHYDDLIIPVTMQQLIDEKLLCPFRVFASGHPDLTGVRTVKGDYDTKPLSTVMQGGKLVADIVDTWKRHGENRKTMAFCVDRAHAKKVQARFVEAGIPWGYIDAFTSRQERDEIRRQLVEGEISGVANVACLTTGVDWPFVSCLIFARPTKSEMFHVQCFGRGLRAYDSKTDCLAFDHADNTLRLGFPTDIHHPELCRLKPGERLQPKKKADLPLECGKCHFMKPPKTHECPACGFKPERVSRIRERDGNLVEVSHLEMRRIWGQRASFYGQLLGYALKHGKKEGWAAYKYREKFGFWPTDYRVRDAQPREPDTETASWIKSQNIRYAKSMQKRQQVAA
jgi:DNA repair protein RadD